LGYLIGRAQQAARNDVGNRTVDGVTGDGYIGKRRRPKLFGERRGKPSVVMSKLLVNGVRKFDRRVTVRRIPASLSVRIRKV
jgi:hypothetical protein